MEEYLDAFAPQWMDLAEPCSPQATQDFFDKEHAAEPKEKLCDSTSKGTENIQPASQDDVSSSNTITKMQKDLSIIKNTPVKMVSPNRDNKEVMVTAITYDQVLNDAMRTLELCKKPPKNRDASSKINQESAVFKTPGVSKITKSSRSIGFYNVQRVQSSQNTVLKFDKINKEIKNVNMRRTLPSHYLFKQDDACVKNNNASKISDARSLDDDKDEERDKEPNERNEGFKEESNKGLNEENNEEEMENNDEFEDESGDHNEEDNEEQQDELQDELMDDNEDKEGNDQGDVDTATGKTRRRQSNKHPSILTWQNHRRRSVYNKRRTSTNNISLAEAVPCCQNETPKRFRTKSGKNNTSALLNPSKMQNRPAPIPPTLVSKTGTCAATALSREEREKLKKRQMKAMPIAPGVLRGPKVAKKPASAYSATQSKSGGIACATNSPRGKNLPPPAGHGKTSSGPKNTVARITVTNTEGIIVQRQTISFFGVPRENSAKSVTRVQPFSFEARNKDLQMKKEQRLKSLQEANKAKMKFRARPAPNFSKPPTNAPRGRRNVDSSKAEDRSTRETENAACAIDKQEASLKRKIHLPELNCAKRAKERHEFEERLKRKKVEEEAKHREEKKKRLEQEKRMKAGLRKLTEVKARPMPKYKSLVVAKATKQLTEPQSPAFASKLKSKLKT